MMNCPKCSDEVLVETPTLGNIPLDVCPSCSGIWFDKGELEALIKQSQSENTANFDLINPKPKGLKCPRCENEMMRGGLVNPLLLVDKCESCGGVWLDANELRLVRKMLGLSEEDSEVKVDRPDPASVHTPIQPVKS
ncbi:MAG: zf-TFIIB domain-containing protein, partial [Elusimicrobiota bacterium]|nr:zf-TFIIB domain-containing protein [Elusimicrobiota bacterium]